MKIPNEIKIFLEELKEQLIVTFKEKIFGVYVYGSLSYGDFEEHRSDIDVFVFLKRNLKKKEIEKLKKIYELPKIKK